MSMVTQGKVNKLETHYPQTTMQIGIHVLSESEAFLESEKEIVRMKGDQFALLRQEVLPYLNGFYSIRDIFPKVEKVMRKEDLTAFLELLTKKGYLHWKEERAVHRPIYFVGEGRLAASWVHHFLKNNLPFTRVSLHYWKAELSQMDEQGWVVVASDLPQDPFFFQLSDWCVAQERSFLFMGLEHNQEAFIGPLWSHEEVNACYRCLQMRLEMNDPKRKEWKKLRSLQEQEQSPPLVQTRSSTYISDVVREAWQAWSGYHAEKKVHITDHVLWKGDGKSDKWNKHRILPVPTCSACGERAYKEIERIKAKNDILGAVDEKVGLVNRIVDMNKDSGERACYAASVLADLGQISSTFRQRTGAGAGENRTVAQAAAVGEGLERFAASLYDPEQLIWASWKEIARDREALHPSSFQFYSAKQLEQQNFRFQAIDEDSPLRWTKTYDWATKQDVWVPAALVYLPYRYRKGEARIMPAISTGLAAGPNLEAAVLTSLYEVIERDAFCHSWLFQLPSRVIAEEWTKSSQVYGENQQGVIRLYDLSIDLPLPAMFVTLEREQVFAIGGACRLDPVQAINKAWLEANQSVIYIQELLHAYREWELDEDFHTVDSFQKHAILYSKYPHLKKQVPYLLNGDYMKGLVQRQKGSYQLFKGEKQEELEKVVAILGERELPVLVKECTTPDLKKLGVHVTRVLIPGFQHLMGNHQYRLLGNPRTREVGRSLPLLDQALNPYPHPFP
nr:McmD2 [Thermoactinomyces sp.]